MKQDPSRRGGFTVLELLVCVSVAGFLLVLVLPAIHRAREVARDLQCRDHLRQVGLALHSYHGSHRQLPPGWSRERTQRTGFGWASRILPQLEQDAIASGIDYQSPLDSPANSSALSVAPAVFLCPSDYAPAMFRLFREQADDPLASSLRGDRPLVPLLRLPSANYVGVYGTQDPDVRPGRPGDGVFMQDRAIRFSEIVGGQSQTFLVGERTARKLPSTWLGVALAGEDAPARVTGFADRGPNVTGSDECEFDSRHLGHVNFLFGDGRVSAVHDTIDTQVYRGMASRR